jgi:hypothetical protein
MQIFQQPNAVFSNIVFVSAVIDFLLVLQLLNILKRRENNPILEQIEGLLTEMVFATS